MHFDTTESEDKLKGEEATQCVYFTGPDHSPVVLIRNPNHGICWGRFYLLKWLASVARCMWTSKHLSDVLVISQHYEYFFYNKHFESKIVSFQVKLSYLLLCAFFKRTSNLNIRA